LSTIDFYSVNQPEMHLSYMSQDELIQKLLKIFEIFEDKIQ